MNAGNSTKPHGHRNFQVGGKEVPLLEENGCEDDLYSPYRMYGGGRRRNVHTLDLKLHVISRIESSDLPLNTQIAYLAKEMDIPIGTLTTWWTQRLSLKEESERDLRKVQITSALESDAKYVFIKNAKKKAKTSAATKQDAKLPEVSKSSTPKKTATPQKSANLKSATPKQTDKSRPSSTPVKADMSKSCLQQQGGSIWPTVWDDLGVLTPEKEVSQDLASKPGKGKKGEVKSCESSTSKIISSPCARKRRDSSISSTNSNNGLTHNPSSPLESSRIADASSERNTTSKKSGPSSARKRKKSQDSDASSLTDDGSDRGSKKRLKKSTGSKTDRSSSNQGEKPSGEWSCRVYINGEEETATESDASDHDGADNDQDDLPPPDETSQKRLEKSFDDLLVDSPLSANNDDNERQDDVDEYQNTPTVDQDTSLPSPSDPLDKDLAQGSNDNSAEVNHDTATNNVTNNISENIPAEHESQTDEGVTTENAPSERTDTAIEESQVTESRDESQGEPAAQEGEEVSLPTIKKEKNKTGEEEIDNEPPDEVITNMLEVVDRPAPPQAPPLNATTLPTANASETATNAPLINHSVAQLIESSSAHLSTSSQSMESNASLSTPPPFSILGSDCSNLVNFNVGSGLAADSNQDEGAGSFTVGSDRMTINTDTSILPELAACSSISIPEDLLNVSQDNSTSIVDNIEEPVSPPHFTLAAYKLEPNADTNNSPPSASLSSSQASVGISNSTTPPPSTRQTSNISSRLRNLPGIQIIRSVDVDIEEETVENTGFSGGQEVETIYDSDDTDEVEMVYESNEGGGDVNVSTATSVTNQYDYDPSEIQEIEEDYAQVAEKSYTDFTNSQQQQQNCQQQPVVVSPPSTQQNVNLYGQMDQNTNSPQVVPIVDNNYGGDTEYILVPDASGQATGYITTSSTQPLQAQGAQAQVTNAQYSYSYNTISQPSTDVLTNFTVDPTTPVYVSNAANADSIAVLQDNADIQQSVNRDIGVTSWPNQEASISGTTFVTTYQNQPNNVVQNSPSAARPFIIQQQNISGQNSPARATANNLTTQQIILSTPIQNSPSSRPYNHTISAINSGGSSSPVRPYSVPQITNPQTSYNTSPARSSPGHRLVTNNRGGAGIVSQGSPRVVTPGSNSPTTSLQGRGGMRGGQPIMLTSRGGGAAVRSRPSVVTGVARGRGGGGGSPRAVQITGARGRGPTPVRGGGGRGRGGPVPMRGATGGRVRMRGGAPAPVRTGHNVAQPAARGGLVVGVRGQPQPVRRGQPSVRRTVVRRRAGARFQHPTIDAFPVNNAPGGSRPFHPNRNANTTANNILATNRSNFQPQTNANNTNINSQQLYTTNANLESTDNMDILSSFGVI